MTVSGDSDEGDRARQTVEAMLARDRASAGLGITVSEVAPGSCRAHMTVTAPMLNGLDVCHGGLLFTLADTAMACASNAATSGGDQMALATFAAIDFLQPGRLGDELTATATETSNQGRNSIFDIPVTTNDGTVIALFRGRTRLVGGSATKAPTHG